MRPETVYSKTFERVQPLAIRLLENATERTDTTLRRALCLALADQEPTEYPYIFRNSFLGREPSRATMDMLAAAIHLIQTSTFVIDDVFDRARRRNGNPTVRACHGDDVAFIAGEVMQGVGLSTLGRIAGRDLPNASRAIAAMSDAVTLVYRGQGLDLMYSSDLRTSRSQYFRLIRHTTGALLAGVARCGALLANRTVAEIESLSDFAQAYGMALQITDDVLDITDETTGKTFGSDLRCRRMRLPMILAMARGSATERAALRRFFIGTKRDRSAIAAAAAVIGRAGGIDGAIATAKRYCARALRALVVIRASREKDMLAWLPESLLSDQELE